MVKRVDITEEENKNVERLYFKYLSYMNMLQYLADQGSTATDIYNEKWNEASQLWIDLEKIKQATEIKYKPKGNWDRYEFDFNNTQMVFINNGE